MYVKWVCVSIKYGCTILSTKIQDNESGRVGEKRKQFASLMCFHTTIFMWSIWNMANLRGPRSGLTVMKREDHWNLKIGTTVHVCTQDYNHGGSCDVLKRHKTLHDWSIARYLSIVLKQNSKVIFLVKPRYTKINK